LQQWQRCLECKVACASTTATTLQWGQQPQLDDSKDACASMMATTPLLQWQQCQLIDYASLTTAETPLQQGQQSPLQWQQRHLLINGNNAIATRATMPLWWRQGYLHINDDKDTIATRVVMQAWGRQWRHCKEWNNTVLDLGWYAIGTRAMMPTWQQQGPLHFNKGNNAIVMRATITMAVTAKMPVHQQQLCHHNKGNYASSMTSKEGSNASLTTAEMHAHQQRQQRHHDESNHCHCNNLINSNDAIMMRATMPALWQAMRATRLAWW
jgi:hypothetical protein